MTLRCKVGDLAWIVNSDDPRNIGKVVEVVRAGPLLCGPDRWIVVCRHAAIYGWRVVGGAPMSVPPGGESMTYDRALRPITNGGFDLELRRELELDAKRNAEQKVADANARARQA